MITRLYLNNCFKHNDVTFTFEKGLTSIIGPNESGKSLILEMIAFALFGSVALRGDADDYRKLHVELDFLGYTVVRKGTRATLTGAREATGTTAVNQAIKEILGYDYKVFTVANICRQNDIEALTNMRPADRKAMVDRTVGLDVLDTVLKVAGDRAKSLRQDVRTTLEVMGPEPVPPVEPEGYRDVTEELKDARDQQQRRHTLLALINNAPTTVEAPGPRPDPRTAADLQTLSNDRAALEAKIARKKAEGQSYQAPTLSEDEIQEMSEEWSRVEGWNANQKLLARGFHQCPACDHQWPLVEGAVMDNGSEPAHPPFSRAELTTEVIRHRDMGKLSLVLKEINQLEAQLEDTPEIDEQLVAVMAWEVQDAAYQRCKEYLTQSEGWKRDLPPDTAGLVTQLEELDRECRMYDTQLAGYKVQRKAWETRQEQVADLRAKADAYDTARANIQEVKTRVKTMLLPSLNQRASQLLNQMTAGERFAIEVDEDFDIKVDGTPVHKLSGSGKAVANLSVRIALGQMLTSRVFSVFCVDEVDASMDQERAAATAEALARLKATMDQVILITHKRPETDHTIELKK